MAFGRTFLYHWDVPRGRIFTNEQEINQALKDGWKEAPYPCLWLIAGEVPGQEDGKTGEPPPKEKGLKEAKPEEMPSTPQPLKPWQKAQAARKAKRKALQGGK